MPLVEPEREETAQDARVREANARVGTLLRGKWRLDALLGIGGMAAVYAATHRNGMRGAVKLLHLAHARDQTIRRRFLREGYIANKVEHAGAVRVLDDDTGAYGSPFLVMELLDGESLETRAEQSGGRLGAQEVLWLAAQLLDTLATAHDRGIVHRDIKPDNLFLTRFGALKVLDFGLAGIWEESTAARTVTQSGSSMGTPAFMSPEQARGRWSLVDGQSDLWSVGATMFALLSGQHVHGEEETVAEMIAATFVKPARSLATVLADAPAPLVALVDRALAREKAQRWLDAQSMSVALAHAYEEIVGAPLPPLPYASMARDSFPAEGRVSLPDSLFSHARSPASSSPPPRSSRPTRTTLPSVRSVPASTTSVQPGRSPAKKGALIGIVLAVTSLLGVLIAIAIERAPRGEATRGVESAPRIDSTIALGSGVASTIASAPVLAFDLPPAPSGMPSAAVSALATRGLAPLPSSGARRAQPVAQPKLVEPSRPAASASTGSMFDRRH